MGLSTIETELLQALTLKIRTFTIEQAAEGWFAGSISEAESCLSWLVDCGLIERRNVYAHPMIEVFPNGKPAVHWMPGDPHPTSQQIESWASAFQSRWNEDEEIFTVFYATKRGAIAMGSHAMSPPSNEQWTHDLHTTAVYLRLLELNSAEQMRSIIGEGALPKLGKEIYPRLFQELALPRKECRIKDPDLFVLNEENEAEAIIEFAGCYDEQHLRDLHQHCSGRAYRVLKKRYPGRKARLYADPMGTEYILL